MKRLLAVLLVAAMALAAGCKSKNTPGGAASQPAGPGAAASADAAKRVVVYMYSEYIDPALCEQFKAETGLEVKIDVYEAPNEMMAKLEQGGDRQYDVVVGSDQVIPSMVKLKMIRELDRAKLSNAANVADNFRKPPYDPDEKFSLPYLWGTLGLIYRKDKVPNFEPTWAMLFDPAKQPSSFVLIDSNRDMFTAALILQGKSINTRSLEEIKAAGELIRQAKKSPKCKGFDGGAGGKNRVAAGEVAMALVYNGDAVRAIDEDKDGNVEFVHPREGTQIWVDAMTIPARAPNPEGAYKFINFILEAKNGAQLANFIRYATPNKAALPLVMEADRKNPRIYPTDEEMKKAQFLLDVDVDNAKYDQVWTDVKAKD